MRTYQFAIAAIGLFCFPDVALAQVALTFDDLAVGHISTQYTSQGATFNFPLVRDYSQMPGFAHSGTQAIELCFAAEFCKATLNVNFTAGEAHVKVFVGFTSQLSQASPVLLRALDQNGALVAQATAVLGPSSGPILVQVPLEVVSSSPSIRQITVGFASSDAFNNGLVFDDLEFDTAGPPPVCTASVPPSVTLAQPQLSTTVQINEFTLQGTVTTEAPLDQATLTVTVAPSSKVTDLLGTIVQPTTGPFGAITVDESLFPGTNIVTVAARNCRGAGQASTTVIYAPVANGTIVKLLGMEITQATQDTINSVRLIAGKPTVVRLYFSTTGSTTSIKSVRGDITGFREGGNDPFLAQSIGTTDIDTSQDVGAKRRDLTKSLNFNLSPDFFGQGLLHFWVVRLNVQGPGGATLACVGCINWSAGFGPSRPLNLIVAPFRYTVSDPPLTASIATVMSGLGWLNNVFPISGNFPADTAGINLIRILPPQTWGFHLPELNDLFLSKLQDILDNMLSQPANNLPADTHLLGVIPSGSGGAAAMPGKVAYGDTRALESTTVPVTDPESYGSIWAQEIAHNFGRMHVSTSHGEMPPTDPNFPYAHGGIGEPGMAIGTEQWNGTPFVLDPGIPASGSKHAHDFMSYGAPNDPQDHTHSWVSPYTYQGLMSSFQAQAQEPGPAAAMQKLVVSGNIDKNGAATLRPFYIVDTAFAKGSGSAGDLSVDLVGASGQTLLTYRFTAHPAENSPSLGFSEFVPWNTETKEIVLKRNQAILARRIVSANKPWVRVTSPTSGETWGAKATITWEAGDVDNEALSYTVFYNTGLDSLWVPVATDVTGLSASVDTRLLVGSTKARVRVRATDGVNTTEADSSGTFTLPDNLPLVTILGTANGQVISRQNSEFSGAAYDPRDGVLPAASLHWTSDRDGSLGHGRHIETTRPLSSGAHIITLTATNSRGGSASTRVNIVAR